MQAVEICGKGNVEIYSPEMTGEAKELTPPNRLLSRSHSDDLVKEGADRAYQVAHWSSKK